MVLGGTGTDVPVHVAGFEGGEQCICPLLLPSSVLGVVSLERQ